jgi:beta-galactosidase
MLMKKSFSVLCIATLYLASLLSLDAHKLSAQDLSKTNPSFSVAGFYPLEKSPRKVYNFNPGWRFYKGDVKNAEKPELDDSSWERASLPHGLEILGENASGMRNYQGKAWYRKTFRTPSPKRAGKSFIYFEAVMGKAKVWVNGKLMAEHFGGYLPFAVELDNKDLLANNVIAVLADNSDDDSYPPGKPQDNLDFTYLGGIYRDVYFIETNPIHITLPELSKTIAGGGVFVAVKDAENSSAKLEVRTEISNSNRVESQITLRTTLEDYNGKRIVQKDTSFKVSSGISAQVSQRISAENIHLWHPDDPYLHYIRTEVVDNGIIVDSYRTRFGIRFFEMRGEAGFYVNKKFIGHKLSGVNRHQDYVHVGNALPNSGQWRDAQLLREGGSNIVRAAHYPLDPAFMDACDELGLLVTSANPGWQYYNDKNPVFEKLLAEDTHNLVRRDRNRPAVLLWETAINETPWQPVSVLTKLHNIVHAEFPFPGAFTVADVDEAKLAGFDFYYHGGLQESKNSFTREYGDGGEVDNFYSQNAATRVKREWGEFPMVQQAMIRARNLREVYGTPPKRIGASIWCGIDHQRGYHPDPFWGGLLDVYRMPRYSYYLFKSQYDPRFKLPGISTGPMVYIAHEITQTSGKDITILSNCDEVRLTWLGKVIGTAKPETTLQGIPHPPFVFKDVFDYHEISSKWRDRTNFIELVAEGLIDGKVVAKQVKKYAGRTTGIRLDIDSVGVGLTADGSDFIPVRASIVDNNGYMKVLATENIHFKVEGEGEIIGGVDNQANPMKTQFGTSTVLIRASTKAGKIKISAFADGLKADEITFSSISSTLPLLYNESEINTDLAQNKSVSETSTKPKEVLKRVQQKALRDKVKRLELELTSRDQDLMELRSKVGNTGN